MADDITYVSFSAEINQNTTESLLAVCADLATKKVGAVYMLFSSQGGFVAQGFTLYNVLRSMPFKLTMHNVGSVNSIANVVFLAGEERYSSPNATFMFHGVGFDIATPTRFEEKSLREKMDSIQADQKRIGKVIVENTSLASDEVDHLFLESVTKDPDYARTKGIIHDIRDVKIPRAHPFCSLYSSGRASFAVGVVL